MSSNDAQAYKTHNWGVKWTEEEDIRLLQGIERFGDNDWRRVSEVVGTRDAVKCQQRWDKVLRPDLLKGKWTDEEDDRLRSVVMEGYDHWGKVSEKMPGRTAKQCRERWSNYLDPNLLKSPFSLAEDEKLLLLQRLNGNKWALISRELPGRTENSVKLRFNSLKKIYGESLATINLSNAIVHDHNNQVYQGQGQQMYDTNKDMRRKADALDSSSDNSAKKARTAAGGHLPMAMTSMHPSGTYYAPLDHSSIHSNLHSNNMNNHNMHLSNNNLMSNNMPHGAMNGQYLHPPPAMPFPPYAMNMMPEHFDMMGHGHMQPNIDVHSMFYPQMTHNNTGYVGHIVHNQPIIEQAALPVPSLLVSEHDDSMKKYASVGEFTEHQSSDEEDNNDQHEE